MEGEIVQGVEMRGGNVHDSLELRMADSAHVDGMYAGVARELHVGEGVSHHQRPCGIYVGKVTKCLQKHADVGFAA